VGGGKVRPSIGGGEVAGVDHRRDHAVWADAAAVVGGEDLDEAVRLERIRLARHDDAAAGAVVSSG
jgi:hypothetical protein